MGMTIHNIAEASPAEMAPFPPTRPPFVIFGPLAGGVGKSRYAPSGAVKQRSSKRSVS